MGRRRVIVGIAVLALVAVAAAFFWPRGPRPCRATFEQVREGMTAEEVNATVGERPFDSSWFPRNNPAMQDGRPCLVESLWEADDGVILQVLYDVETERVVSVDILPIPTRWGRIRARFGL